MLIAFHKPYGVISQFTPDDSGLRTLAEFGFPPRVYPIGRLDADSEGLLLLSDEAGLNERLIHPRRRHRRVYWAQVEPGQTGTRHLDSRTKNFAVSRVVAETAAGTASPRSADPLSQDSSHLLDRFGTGRREKPASAADDRGCRTSDAAAPTGANRRFQVERFDDGQMEDFERAGAWFGFATDAPTRLGRAEFHLHADSEYQAGAGGTTPAQMIQRGTGKFSFLSRQSPYATAPLATWVCDFSTR